MVVSSLPNTAIQSTQPGFEPWTLALRAAALYRLRQSDRTKSLLIEDNEKVQYSVIEFYYIFMFIRLKKLMYFI